VRGRAAWRCDCHYPAGWKDKCLNGEPPAVHTSTSPEGIEMAAAARGPAERLAPLPELAEHPLPIISVALGSTSRGYRWRELQDSPLVKILLASVPRTLEPGFEYRFYVTPPPPLSVLTGHVLSFSLY
jgi:hypothetical protein